MKNVLKKAIAFVLAIELTITGFGAPLEQVYADAPETKVQSIVDGMTLRDKITQCFMVDFRQWDQDGVTGADMTELSPEVAGIISEYKFGSIILFAENIKETEKTEKLTRDMQMAVTSGGGIPLLIAADQEGGIVFRLGTGCAMPGNMALGATGDKENAKSVGSVIGSELDAVGINTTLAPVMDVNNNANNPVIGLRSFSDDPDMVGEFGSKYIEGLNEYNIIGCAKHFPGHGDTATDSHMGLPMVDKDMETLKKTEFKPFEIAIDGGIDMIMTAHILYPQLDDTTIISTKTEKAEKRPATLSSKILTDILRKDMGFNGVIVTDAMNMKGVSDAFYAKQSVLEAMKAGADLICMPVTGVTNKAEWTVEMEEIISSVQTAVISGELPEAQLNDSVKRIVSLKEKKGILDYNPANYSAEKALSVVGSAKNREVERQIAAKAVTVIRNEGNVLPLQPEKTGKILFMAPYDNEKAQLVMGINRAKAAGLVPAETEVKIYRYSDKDYVVENALKDSIDWADTVILNSEISSAKNMTYDTWLSAGPKNITDYCKEAGKKSVVISNNKPYDVQLYPNADAVLAVYGSKGSSVDVSSGVGLFDLLSGKVIDDKKAFGPNIVAGVEVIFGVYGATGKLPINIPVFDMEKKVYTDEIKYERGYGLSYESLLNKTSKSSGSGGSGGGVAVKKDTAGTSTTSTEGNVTTTITKNADGSTTTKAVVKEKTYTATVTISTDKSGKVTGVTAKVTTTSAKIKKINLVSVAKNVYKLAGKRDEKVALTIKNGGKKVKVTFNSKVLRKNPKKVVLKKGSKKTKVKTKKLSKKLASLKSGSYKIVSK